MPYSEERGFARDDTLVQFGSAIRASDDGHIGGHLVLFGNPDERDLYGDFFTSGTDFDLQPKTKTAVYYQHGFDYHFQKNVLSRATLGVDDIGIWIDTQLMIRDEYEQALADLIAENIMGWSSGTASHLVEFQRVGKAYWIKRWPLGLDASITPAPADPRQSIETLKFLEAEWEKQYGKAVHEDAPLYFSFKSLRDRRVPTRTGPEGRVTPEEVAVETDLTVTEPVNIVIEVKTMPDQNGGTPRDVPVTRSEFDQLSRDLGEVMEFIRTERSLRGARYVTDDGGEADPEVRTLGDFCMAVMRKDTVRLRKHYKSHPWHESPAAGVKTTMVEDSGNLGGWAIPEDFDNRLLQATVKASTFLGLIPRTPVTVPSGRWPYLDIFQTPTAGGGGDAESAGITSQGRAEGGEYQETNAELDELEYRVNDAITGLVSVSKELRRDVPALEGLLQRLIAINDQSKQEYFVLRGSGVAQPLGILNSGAVIDITPATNSLFSWVDALVMTSRLYALDESAVIWLFHPSVIPDIGTMEVGTAGGATFVANLSAGVPMPILGYPGKKTQHLPQANNSGDVLLLDPTAYQIWDLGGAYLDFSEHVEFKTGKDVWRFGRYMDGKPLWPNVITLSDPQGGFTQSPFVRHND